MKPDRFAEEQVIGELKEHEPGAKTADAMLGNTALNDQLSKMVTPAVKREAVAHLRARMR